MARVGGTGHRDRSGHLSLYILEVYPASSVEAGDADRMDGPRSPTRWRRRCTSQRWRCSTTAGYEQYEISNVAKPGRQSLHNLKYWTDGEWWGFGPGAHSTWRGSRWRNVAADRGLRRPDSGRASVVAERRSLSGDEQLGDALFTGLRLNRGVDLSILSRRYAVDIWERFGERLALRGGRVAGEGGEPDPADPAGDAAGQ